MLWHAVFWWPQDSENSLLCSCTIKFRNGPLTLKRALKSWRKFQRKRATKFIRTDGCFAGRLKKLNLLPLEKRRLLPHVTFLYKAPHGIIDIDVETYVDFYNDKLTLKMRYARTHVLKYTFFHRVVLGNVELPSPFHSWGNKCKFF